MTQKQTAVVSQVNGIQEAMPAWMTKGSKGNENVTANEMVLPRVDVLQALSPQLKKSDPSFIAGAEQGNFFNTVTGELYGNTLMVVPVSFKKEYVLWKLRQHGGGFVGAFGTQHEADAKLATMTDPSQFEVVESHQHFCLILTEGGVHEAVLSMTKSKLKVSRSLNTLVQMAGVDRFAKAYKMESCEVSGDKGDYWSYRAHPAGFVDEVLYKRGNELYELIKAGLADVDRNDTTTETVVAQEL